MQQIERYGVIALVFLLVTIVAVSFWGDSKSPGFWSRITGRGAKPVEVASMLPPPATSDTAIQAPLPLNPQGQPSATPIAGNDLVAPPTGAQPKDSPLVVLGGSTNAPTNSNGFVNNSPMVNTPVPPMQKPIVPESPIAQTSTGEYVVAKGDTGSKIAQKTLGNGKRWSEIAALNPGVDSKSLKIGAHLKLPSNATSVATAPGTSKPMSDKSLIAFKDPVKTPSAHGDAKKIEALSKHALPAGTKKSTGTQSYTVHAGDTLAAIARRELGDGSRWQEIVALNPGLEGKSLAAGKEIRLPGARAEKPLVTAAEISSDRMGVEKPRVR